MRTLALSDEILMKVDKAARYIGGEVNSVMKDKNDVDIRFAMCFPDVYEIGMSNLGVKMSGVSVSFLRGWIWIKLCVRNIFLSLPWNPRSL